MKKITAFFAAVLFGVAVYAQDAANFYKFTSVQEADKVITVLTTQLKLNAKESSAVAELIKTSAQSQVEQYKLEQNKDVNMVNMIVSRQTRHIEANLKNIIGEERFRLYETNKTKYAAQAKETKN